MDIPENLRYSKEHEWALIEGDTVTVGITEYAVDELGDIVYVELPDPGTGIDQNAVFGTIESVKAVAELFAPISGDIEACNEDLLETPELVNEDPYGDAWMLKMKATDPEEFEELLTPQQYQAYLDEIS